MAAWDEGVKRMRIRRVENKKQRDLAFSWGQTVLERQRSGIPQCRMTDDGFYTIMFHVIKTIHVTFKMYASIYVTTYRDDRFDTMLCVWNLHFTVVVLQQATRGRSLNYSLTTNEWICFLSHIFSPCPSSPTEKGFQVELKVPESEWFQLQEHRNAGNICFSWENCWPGLMGCF